MIKCVIIVLMVILCSSCGQRHQHKYQVVNMGDLKTGFDLIVLTGHPSYDGGYFKFTG